MKSKVNNYNHQQHVTAFTPNLSPLKVNNIKARTTKNLLIQRMKVVNGGNCSRNNNTQQQQGNTRNKISINNINVNTKHFNVNANAFDFAVFAQAKLKHTATSKDVCDVSNTHIHNVNANANASTSNSLTKKIISNLRNQFNEITKHKCTSVSTSVNMQSPMNTNYNTPNANAYIVNNTQQQQQQTHINKHNKPNINNNNNNYTQQQDSMYLHLTTQHSTNNSKSKSKNKHQHHQHRNNIQHKTNNVKSDNTSYTSNTNTNTNTNNIKLKSQHTKKEAYTCINSRNNSKYKDTTNNYYETEHLTLESLNFEDMKRQYIVTDLAQERLTHTITPSKPPSHTNNNNNSNYLSHVIEVLKNIILIQQRSYNEMITKYKQQHEHVLKQLQHKVDFLLKENNALKRYIMNIFACVAVYEDTTQSEDNKRNQLLSKMLIENVYLRQMNQFVGGKWNSSGSGSDVRKQKVMMGVRDSCLYKKGHHGCDNLNLTYIHVDGDNEGKGNKEWNGKDKYSQVLGRNGKCNNKSYSYEHKSGSGSCGSNTSSNNGKLIKCPKMKISYNQYKNN